MLIQSQSIITNINQSMNAMLLLHSSCQAIIEAEVAQVSSSWYTKLDEELGEAENLVIGWRQNGYLYFHQMILQEIINYSQLFLAAKNKLDTLFKQLNDSFSSEIIEKITNILEALMPPLLEMVNQVKQYENKLTLFEENMQKPHTEMSQTIAQVQEQEQDIADEIKTINTQIDALKTQIQNDRAAISKAKKARTTGIIETIFGVILAPLSFGASLVLAGIGVATIAQAEDKINGIQSEISKYQGKISSEQKILNKDQKIIATLNGLLMSVQICIKDISLIASALDNLRLDWDVLNGELSDEVDKLKKSTNAQQAILVQAWFDAACKEWDIIIQHTTNLNNRTLTTTHITIG